MWQNFFKRSFFTFFLLIFCFFSPLALASKLAIVIDDIGYSQKEDSAIYALPKEVNVAIIPSAPHALARAELAFQQKRDILIHFPMQPKNLQQAVEKEALRVGDSYAQAVQLLNEARAKVPYAIGLNNHMGSAATADLATMQNFMTALAEQKLFFLDSKTGKSVAAQTAKKLGINTLERHFFLDDSNVLSDVQQQFDAAIAYAHKHGVAVLIGHPRKNSVAVLQKGIKNLPSDIQLTGIGSLWRNEKVEPQRAFIVIFDIEPAPTSVKPFIESSPLLRGIPKE